MLKLTAVALGLLTTLSLIPSAQAIPVSVNIRAGEPHHRSDRQELRHRRHSAYSREGRFRGREYRGREYRGGEESHRRYGERSENMSHQADNGRQVERSQNISHQSGERHNARSQPQVRERQEHNSNGGSERRERP